MSVGLRLTISGDDTFVQYLRDYPKVARKAGKLAINDTIRRGRRMVKQEIMTQVNLSSSYLNKSRLTENFASEQNLTGSIVGRRRPTSLARFDTEQLYAPNKTRSGKKRNGVSLKVKSRRKVIPRAFLMDLKAGSRDGGNKGLVIRLPDGQKPKRKFRAKPLYKDRQTNLWLLYGPSVNQVMSSEKGGESMITKMQPQLNSYLNREFRRQFGRLYGG